MEVHPPHQTVHTWRDFATHLIIVTIGLFIALTLESLVERVHHHNLVRDARENIRQEIEDNHHAAQHDLVNLQQDSDRVKANIVAIHALMKDAKNFHGSLSYTMQFESLKSAAWDTSRDTGALSHMSYKEVQGYADLYDDQKLVNDESIAIFRRQTLAMTPVFMGAGFDLSAIPATEMQGLLHETAATLISLETLKQILQQLDSRYVAALKTP